MQSNIYQTVMFLCEYKSIYGGNFIPSLLAIDDELKRKNVVCIYAFPEEATERYWYQKLVEMGKKTVIYTLSGTRVQKAKEIKKLVQENKVTLLHTHFISISAIECLSFICPNLKIVIHLHSDFDAGNYSWKKKLRDYLLYHFLAKNVCFLSVSKALSDKNPKKIEYFPNALANKRIPCEPLDSESVRDQLGIKKEEIMIELFGWSPIVKGVDIAVNAVKVVNEQYGIKVKLAVICGREMTPMKMQQWVVDNTKCSEQEPYLAYLEPIESVFSYHEASDILLSASRSEGFSYSVLEMLSLGKRCVISDIPGVAWAKEYETVTTFESGNVESCVKGILRAIQSIPQTSEATAARIAMKYSVDEWAKAIVEEYGI